MALSYHQHIDDDNNNNNDDILNNNNDNNNYMPSFYGEPATLLQSRPPVMDGSSQFRSFGTGGQHTFTFSSPTQGVTGSTHRPSIQTTCAMPFGWAPGAGTAWQHSPPTPRMSILSGNPSPYLYTGMPQRLDPQPSCSSPMKRPKRKAQDSADGAPMSKVLLCTDKFANMSLNPDTATGTANGEMKCHDPSGWGRFQQVENNIACECESDEEEKMRSHKSKEGVLVMDDSITESMSASQSASLLPRNVIRELAKPCMQVVLWKSPGELVRDFVRDDTSSLSPDPPVCKTTITNTHSPHYTPSTPFHQSQPTMPSSSNYSQPSNHNRWNSPAKSPLLATPSLSVNQTNRLNTTSSLNQFPPQWDSNLDLDLQDEDMQL